MYDLAMLGIGRVGLRTLEFLLSWKNNLRILGLDCVDRSRVLQERKLNVDFVKTCKPSDVLKHSKGIELIATALPSSIIYDYVERLIMNKSNVIDVSYIDFDPYVFNNTCLSNRVAYVPDAGFAPGFSNLIVGYMSRKLSGLDTVEIYVGGIPVEPKPPLYYEITWSPEDLIEEYTRNAKLIINGEIIEVDPLSQVIKVNIPGQGVFDGFYSDGLHTLLRNIRVRNMFEVTIRYPGHLDRIKTLRELGFFDDEPIDVGGIMIPPKQFTAKLLSTKFQQVSRDKAILYVITTKGGSKYSVISVLQREHGSATVDFTSAVFAETIMIALEEDLKPGVHPLEDFSEHFDRYVGRLRSIGVSISVS